MIIVIDRPTSNSKHWYIVSAICHVSVAQERSKQIHGTFELMYE